jgi:uracil-DNA glycosylase
MSTPNIEPSWLAILQSEFDEGYMQDLRAFLREEMQSGHTIYPPMNQLFTAFWNTPFPNVKVIILGQDPYHGPKQAHGLSFSVQRGIRPPPSLKNIYKERKADLEIDPSEHGDLSEWSKRGVLLLNTVLTVRARSAGSHQGKGWERFTDRVIFELNEQRKNLVFVLWGKKAEAKTSMIDQDKHLIISSAHPSPYSADRGFFGSQPFSKINSYLTQNQIEPIDWSLPN